MIRCEEVPAPTPQYQFKGSICCVYDSFGGGGVGSGSNHGVKDEIPKACCD